MKISELLLDVAKFLSWNDLTDKPSTFPPQTHNHSAADINEDAAHKFVSETEKQTWNNKAGKSSTHNVTLLANNWTGSIAPFIQSIIIPGMNDAKNWEVTNTVNPIMTHEQLNAFSNAKIIAGQQSTNTINLVAYGEKPIIDIPILVIVRED